MKLNYPKVKQDSNLRVYVDFTHEGKRYRMYNGKRINSKLSPNTFPIDQRQEVGKLLAAEVYKFIISGKRLDLFQKSKFIKASMSDKDYLKAALDIKLKGKYSEKYKSMLQYVYGLIDRVVKVDSINLNDLTDLLNSYSSEVSHNTIKRHLQVLFNEAERLGMKANPMANIKSKKTKSKLHKPFKNISELLDEVKEFNANLHLCCLLTYGCLLRPHREVRELTWNDFSDDLSFIYLSGDRNKSGRNRIVPIPSFIKPYLNKQDGNKNIFSNSSSAPNKDYFKTLWSRFKKRSNTLEEYQTLYSFRHSGAIEIFKRTGSITKLQKAMGHSSINVSLTYLRGLEIAELKEQDMPMVDENS
ncbi:MAG: tyrosine-type recombinase/integrase [Polaribacter sp.]